MDEKENDMVHCVTKAVLESTISHLGLPRELFSSICATLWVRLIKAQVVLPVGLNPNWSDEN